MKTSIIIIIIITFVILFTFIFICLKFSWEKKIIPGITNSNYHFPKIIHQTWKNTNLNTDQQNSVDSWKKYYPDYQHILWTDDDIEKFVHTHFYWYLPIWNKLTPFIKKIDCIRYMWMYIYGGIYVDIDMICMKHFNFENNKYKGSAFIPVQLPYSKFLGSSSPAILASYPGHDFWLSMLDYISKNYDKHVFIATGPTGLVKCLSSYINSTKNIQKIVLLNETKFGIGLARKLGKKYSYHQMLGTWLNK